MTTPRAAKPRFPFGLTVAAAIALALLLGLGRWQVQRLHWKEDLLAKIAALRDAPPQPLAAVLRRAAHAADVDFTRVQIDCPSVQATPYLRLYGVRDAMAGFHIITACPLTGGAYGAVLVDRGFLPQDEAGQIHLAAGDAIRQAVIGVLRRGDAKTFVTPDNQPAQRLFYFRDIPAMAQVLGVSRPAPTFLMLEQPAPPPGGPSPAPLPTDIPNHHLEYAVTWFGLAAGLLCVYLATLWRWLRSA